MAQRKTLTEQQVEVLRWIGDGCPAGVMPDTHHRIIAAALRRRGLVRVTGKRKTWSATVTSSGREYLEAVDGPNPPIPRRPNKKKTSGIVELVVDAGGTLKIPDRDDEPGGLDLERRARLAQEHGEVPDEKWLICVAAGDGREIRLIDATQQRSEYFGQLIPVEIPERVGRYRPVVRQLRDDKARHEVSRAQIPRLIKIAQAITVEAERRGWKVEAAPAPTDEHDRRRTAVKNADLILIANEMEFTLRFQEKGVDVRGPWDDRYRAYREPTSYWAPSRPEGHYDTRATGELQIQLDGGDYRASHGRQHKWSDRKSWQLEERLPHLFREIEARIENTVRVKEKRRIEAEEKAERKRRAAEARRIEWEQHLDYAREQLLEKQRGQILRDQASRWTEAQSLRTYRDKMATHFKGNPETAAWIEWIDQFISGLDPLSTQPILPAVPEESVDALQPFMPGDWSAKDPELRFDPRRGHVTPSPYRW